MAEQDSDSGEKEFEATEQRRQQAREEGNVPQSKETNTLALIVGTMVAALVLQVAIGGAVFQDFSSVLYHADAFSDDIFNSGGTETRSWLSSTLVKFAPIPLILAAIVLLSLVAQRSISFSAKKIQADPKKLSPFENLKKKYGAKGLLDFLKDTVKLIFAATLAIVFLVQLAQVYYASSAIQRGQVAEFTFCQVLKLIFGFLLFQFVLAAIDLPLQRRLHANQLKMSREEMKKEMKQSEGDPQLKQQRRQKASQITRGQMLTNVKDATVVMVNPEHYAVALKWDPESSKAPVCVAKGVDHLAARIREIATANNVPIYRDPPATRSMYSLVEVDEEIRPEHFAAVAAAINFVERIRKHME
jgi:flagellar biosynthetic protein FlhB